MVAAVEFLVRSQNADGGWGYHPGGMSYVEPTAAVLLALRKQQGSAVLSDLTSSVTRARDFLFSLQHGDGGWGIGAVDGDSGWMTGWAVMALMALSGADAAIAAGVNWLLATEGLRFTDPVARSQVQSVIRIDSALLGWPWQTGDASWVHPTALAILALCQASRQEHPRVRAGVELLLDRAVGSGGWNIGNPEMFGKSLPATIQDTALALLALNAAGTPGDDSRIKKGLEFAREAIKRENTPAELAWGIYGLRSWNSETGDASARLARLQSADGSWRRNPFTTAIAVLAGQA